VESPQVSFAAISEPLGVSTQLEIAVRGTHHPHRTASARDWETKLLPLAQTKTAAAMSLHDWLGTHIPDLKDSHWDGGHFVTRCTICGKTMVKPPGMKWQLKTGRG
jgi:hypothetical protein